MNGFTSAPKIMKRQLIMLLDLLISFLLKTYIVKVLLCLLSLSFNGCGFTFQYFIY